MSAILLAGIAIIGWLVVHRNENVAIKEPPRPVERRRPPPEKERDDPITEWVVMNHPHAVFDAAPRNTDALYHPLFPGCPISFRDGYAVTTPRR